MKMFICFNHVLTASQIEDAKKSLGVTEFVLLSKVNPELFKQFANVSPTATNRQITNLAYRIVQEAIKNGCKIFYCAGEATVTLWANIYASRFVENIDYEHHYRDHTEEDRPEEEMECVTSTTERVSVEVTNPDGSVTKTNTFKHVMWRNLFNYL